MSSRLSDRDQPGSNQNSFCIDSTSQLAAAGHQHQAVGQQGVSESVISLVLFSFFFSQFEYGFEFNFHQLMDEISVHKAKAVVPSDRDCWLQSP